MANRPGRPPLDPTDPSVVVSVALPGRRFDRLYRRASLERVSVPEIIRRALFDYSNKKIQTPGA
jgi:hypothetical protein